MATRIMRALDAAVPVFGIIVHGGGFPVAGGLGGSGLGFGIGVILPVGGLQGK